MDYDKFIKLAVITSMLALPRPTLREKICQGSEIAEVLHDDPATKQYLFSFYNSQFQTVMMLNQNHLLYSAFSFSDVWLLLSKNWKWTDFSIHITNITQEKWESWLTISSSRSVFSFQFTFIFQKMLKLLVHALGKTNYFRLTIQWVWTTWHRLSVLVQLLSTKNLLHSLQLVVFMPRLTKVWSP